MSSPSRSRWWTPAALGLLVALGAGGAAAQGNPEGLNLLENGSFERHAPVHGNRSVIVPSIPGWIAPGQHVELHTGNRAGIEPVDGTTKIELDGDFNYSLHQDVNLDPLRRHRLELHYAPRWNRSRTDSNDLEIEWADAPLARLGGDRRYWRRHVFDLAAAAPVARLLLRGAGPSDGRGALVDAMSLTSVPYRTGNLVSNGSFEQPESFGHRTGKVFAEIPGWRATSGALELHRHQHASLEPREGEVLLSLHGKYQDTAEQEIVLAPGLRHDLSVVFSPRRSSGGDVVEVWAGDTRVAVLEGRRKVWHRRRLVLEPVASPLRLTLRAPERSPGQHGHPGHRHDDDDDDDDRDHDHDHRHGDDEDDHGDDDDEDDHRRGSRNHGGLIDDVRLYGACWLGGNRVINPSFEEHPRLGHHDRATFLTIPGWRAAAGHIEIHRYGGKGASLLAAEGMDHLELGGNGEVQVVQDIPTEPGATYLLELAWSPRVEHPGTTRNDVEIWWDGALLTTLSGDRKGWRFLRLPVRASGERTELRLAGPGARGGKGPQIDEVRLLPVADLTLVSAPPDEARAGEAYAYQPQVADARAVEPVFELLEGPAGMTVDPVTGAVTWPLPVDGVHPVRLQVNDACGRRAVQAWEIRIVESNQPPRIVTTPITTTPLFHLRPRITVVEDNPASERVLLNGVPFVSGSAISADGLYVSEIEATDAAGNTATRRLEFTIDRSAGP